MTTIETQTEKPRSGICRSLPHRASSRLYSFRSMCHLRKFNGLWGSNCAVMDLRVSTGRLNRWAFDELIYCVPTNQKTEKTTWQTTIYSFRKRWTR